jgi:hypothetical protein
MCIHTEIFIYVYMEQTRESIHIRLLYLWHIGNRYPTIVARTATFLVCVIEVYNGPQLAALGPIGPT